MNPYTGNPEIDRYISERLSILPPALKEAIENDVMFDALEKYITGLGVVDELVIQGIKHEVLLVLLQIEPLEDIFTTIAREYESVEPKNILAVSEFIENELLKNYKTYLQNLTDAEDIATVDTPEITGAVTEKTVPEPIPVPTPKPLTETKPAPANIAGIPAKPYVEQPPIPVRKEPGMIGARTMNSDIATLKKSEGVKPLQLSQVPIPPTPKAPIVQAPEPIPIPRYAKPLTDLPRYGGTETK